MKIILAAFAASLAVQTDMTNAASLELEQFIPGSPLSNPIKLAAPIGDNENVYVLDRTSGAVTAYNTATGVAAPAPFLTLPVDFQPGGFYNAFSIAFAPDYAQSGKVYVSYVDIRDNLQVSVATRSTSNPNQVDQSTFHSVLNVKHEPVGPGTHYGADLDFGPDGYLYITTGDNDEAFENVQSQNLANLQGKILRVDPSGDDFQNGDEVNNFAVPIDNPTHSPDPAVTDAIWASGLRNPFQAAFDPLSGKYVIGDIGEDLFEEINIGAPGANYGWPGKEGFSIFQSGIAATILSPTDPLYAYSHGTGPFDGASITGGLFYKGSISTLVGRYLFADFVAGKIWSMDIAADGRGFSNLLLWNLMSQVALPQNIVSFGEDGLGNVYIVTLDNGIYRITGASAEDVPIPPALLLLVSALGGFGALGTWKRVPTAK